MTASARTARSLLWWDLAVAGVSVFPCYALVAPRVAGDATMQGPWFWAGAASWAGLLVAYVAIARTGLRRSLQDLPRRPVDAVFIGMLVLACGVVAAVYPTLAVVQAVGHPLLWMLSRSLTAAIAGSTALAVCVGAGMSVALARGGDAHPWILATIVQALSLGFVLVIGSWIAHVSREGDRQRRLVAELTEAQARIARLSEESGASAERERLSRELHDTLTQTLTGLAMLTEQAGRAFDAGDAARGRERIARVEAAARSAVSEARAIVASAHPLGDGRLEAALTRAAERLHGDAGIEVRCEFDSRASISRAHQVVLLRAVQEGLANVRAHAQASSVRLRLRDAPDGHVELSILDDGIGPDTQNPHDERLLGGYGISGLRERLRPVRGELDFGPAPGGGARLVVRVPAAPAPPEEGEKA